MIFPSLLFFDNWGLFILRLAIGLIFIYHAIPKVKNAKGMAGMMGMANMGGMILLLGSIELLSGISIIFGYLTQLAALLLAIVMVGSILMKIMRWHVPFAAMDKTGWEFDLILLAAALAILFTGGGSFVIQP
ncbi:MAG: DoxX family protein [Candidatus Liptonbacteria bacterium]|nr:DoxX family protein [Candidatus Liptonbacteria bacterium]